MHECISRYRAAQNQNWQFFRERTGKTGKTKRECRRGKWSRSIKQKEVTCEGIFNLSGIEFTKAEKIILNKGLKFVPYKPLNKFQTFIDVQKYVRKLNIKRHFLSIPKGTSIVNRVKPSGTGLRNASTFNPPRNPAPTIVVFKDLVLQDLQKVVFKNYKKQQSIATDSIKTLCERKDLIIRPRYRGRGTVLLKKNKII